MRITEAASTYCFVGHKGRQAQVVRVVVAEAGPSAEVTVRIEGAGLITAEPWRGRLDPARAGQPGGPAWAPSEDAGLRAAGRFVPRPPTPEGAIVEVPVLFDAQPGQVVAGRVIASSGADGARVAGAARAEREVELVVREPGWRMIMVPHFHYDPVWWNTQAGYTSGWDELLWALERRETFQHSGLALVEAHLERARLDAAYKFVLAEVDYLKPFWDLYPDRRDELRSLIRDGRLEIVGGTYNEPNTNLTGAETAIRVAVYGMGFQREVMGASPRTAWQLDVFGHDPQFPGIMADCGLESSAWARGPFHQWGPRREAGSNAWMQFPSEFEWVAPNGLGLLTSYMPDHYSAGWELESATTLEGAMWRAYELFCDLAEVAATRVTLLPVGTDYTPPGRFVSGVARAWSARYAWPRFEVGLPKEFFAAVRAELAERGRRPAPQSRDMGPVYTGKEVSFIDTKQAQRLAETWLAEAEHMAALASLVGAAVPRRALDKAWRQLVFGAHHDGITGSSSDQVYLDLLGGWRESYEIARAVEGEARRRFLGEVSTAGEGDAVVVTNSLGHDRSEMTALELPRPRSGRAYEIRDETGQVLASLSEPAANAQVSVRFLAKDVPGTGHRTFRVASRSARARPGWVAAPGNAIANDYLEIEAAPGRGGGLARVRDRAGQFELVPTGEVGNELLVYPEYADHPRFGEGPWHLLPCGPPVRSGAKGASVRRQTSPLGERLVIDGELVYGETGVGAERESVQYRQFVTLWRESRRVELRTELHGWQGRDRLVRLRFPTTLGGATPVSAVGDAVVARSFAFIEADAAVAPWTLDQGAAEWFGLSTTLVVEVAESSAERDAIYHRSPLGVAEVVTAGGDGAAPWARDLVVALLQKGVTATCSEAPRNRYGGLLGDSNLPDFRIAIGGPG
ncbi:MAG TPA: hypothetical protein VK425_04045, partial [Acidimicrobiales bacterium]|nr:hypothetical protein [Acidimicrobiales bacterium]